MSKVKIVEFSATERVLSVLRLVHPDGATRDYIARCLRLNKKVVSSCLNVLMEKRYVEFKEQSALIFVYAVGKE